MKVILILLLFLLGCSGGENSDVCSEILSSHERRKSVEQVVLKTSFYEALSREWGRPMQDTKPVLGSGIIVQATPGHTGDAIKIKVK